MTRDLLFIYITPNLTPATNTGVAAIRGTTVNIRFDSTFAIG
jgi:hypothetical protein